MCNKMMMKVLHFECNNSCKNVNDKMFFSQHLHRAT